MTVHAGASVASARWTGEPGTTGIVAVVGMGKIGLPLAAQYAGAGWRVIGVDVVPEVVDALNAGRVHVHEEQGLDERIAAAVDAGLFSATLSHADAAAAADVVVMIVPLALGDDLRPAYRHLDAATAAVGAGLRAGTLVIYETTLPVGDTRGRFGPALAQASGLTAGDASDGFLLAFSPERVSSGVIFRDLRTYPKLVGGIDTESTARAAAFYRSVLPAEVWELTSAETAEFAKLAETTYRDVNIAFVNQLAEYAERVGVDIAEATRGANSQPYSHLHQPGLGVGGHCIPVYPHFFLARDPDLEMISLARAINERQVPRAIERLESVVGSLGGASVLVLGVTYRAGVKELANSRALALIRQLRDRGATVTAFDPLLSDEEIRAVGAEPYHWGEESPAVAVVTQTADPLFVTLDPARFPSLRAVYDGRDSLRALSLPPGVVRLGVGTPSSEPVARPGAPD